MPPSGRPPRHSQIDLNCDLGEGCPHDAELLALVSSANIACGAHAGDPDTLRRTLWLALEQGVSVGAHPGYADPQHFGRRELHLPDPDLIDLVTRQLDLFRLTCDAVGIRPAHVKLHGALYNQASRDARIADAVIRALQLAAPGLIFVVLSGSLLARLGQDAGLPIAQEVFADRRYLPDGSLVPRSHPQAVIRNEQDAVGQVLQMLQTGSVTPLSNPAASPTPIPLTPDTLCLHGDSPHAPAFARLLRDTLCAHGISIRPLTIPPCNTAPCSSPSPG